MGLSDIPILSMLRTRLQWAQERQRVLAENVANSDTPNFQPRDLTPPVFGDPTRVAASSVANVVMATTEQGHIAGALSGVSASGAPAVSAENVSIALAVGPAAFALSGPST